MAADCSPGEELNSAWTQGMPDVLCYMCETAAGNDAHALNLLIFKSAQEASYSDCPCQLETRQKPPPHRYSQRKCPKNIILPHCQHTRNAPHFTLPNAMNFLIECIYFSYLGYSSYIFIHEQGFISGVSKSQEHVKKFRRNWLGKYEDNFWFIFASQVEADKNHLVIVSLN